MKSLLGLLCVAICATLFASPLARAQQGQQGLTIWINGDKAIKGLQAVGDRFAKDLGVPVTVQAPEAPTDKFVQAAQAGKGPDIFFWAHDRLGEFADAGLVQPLNISADLKGKVMDAGWEGFTHNGRVYGYPVALEAIGLIYNKKLVDKPAASLEEAMAMKDKLGAGKTVIMWDYNNTYFTWPFLAAGGGYVFAKDAAGNFNPKDTGVDEPGAIAALDTIVKLINAGVLPSGTTYSVMEAKMNSGELAMMISGPWAWGNLKKSGIDFGVAPLPSVGGKPAQPFIGVLGAMINRSSPNADLAKEFLERYVLTDAGLKSMDDDVPLGVPALKSYAQTRNSDPNVAGTMKNVELGKPMPNIPAMAKFWDTMKGALGNATAGQASAADALKNAARQIEQ